MFAVLGAVVSGITSKGALSLTGDLRACRFWQKGRSRQAWPQTGH